MYARMSVPFVNADEANDAVSGFFAAVEAARQQFRIRELVVIGIVGVSRRGATSAADAEGPGATLAPGYQTNDFMVVRMFGDSSAWAPMLAQTLGHEQASETERHIARGRAAARERNPSGTNAARPDAAPTSTKAPRKPRLRKSATPPAER